MATGCSAVSAESVVVNNSIDSCLGVSIEELRDVGTVTLADADLERVQSTAACGCKSRLVHYTVDGFGDGFEHESIAQGQLSDGASRSFTFVINPDNAVDGYTQYRLHTGCMPPR
ncbi:DUF2195 family protein [Halomonadaceae bacterium KBTZ08]